MVEMERLQGRNHAVYKYDIQVFFRASSPRGKPYKKLDEN
jgi:hypothetical protein